jgi:hypothetical protein
MSSLCHHYVTVQALGSSAFHIVPLSFCIPEELHAWRAWLASPGAAAADTGELSRATAWGAERMMGLLMS